MSSFIHRFFFIIVNTTVLHDLRLTESMDENFLLLLIVFHLGPLNTNVCLFHLDRFFKFYLFIYFRLCWVFIAVCQLSLVAASRGYSSLQRLGFSLMWLLLWSTGSGAWGLGSCCAGVSAVIAHQLSCSVACGIFWTGIKPVSPALVGGFLSPVPPGKSWIDS